MIKFKRLEKLVIFNYTLKARIVLFIILLFLLNLSCIHVKPECQESDDSPKLIAMLEKYTKGEYLTSYAIVSKSENEENDRSRVKEMARAELAKTIKIRIRDSVEVIIQNRSEGTGNVDQLEVLKSHTIGTTDQILLGVDVITKADNCHRYAVAYLSFEKTIIFLKSNLSKLSLKINNSIEDPNYGSEAMLIRKRIIRALSKLSVAYEDALDRESYLMDIVIFESLRGDERNGFKSQTMGTNGDKEVTSAKYSFVNIWDRMEDILERIHIDKIGGEDQSGKRGEQLEPFAVKVYFEDKDKTKYPLEGVKIKYVTKPKKNGTFTEISDTDSEGITSSKLTIGESAADNISVRCSVDYDHMFANLDIFKKSQYSNKSMLFEPRIEDVVSVEEGSRILARGFTNLFDNVKYYQKGFEFENEILKEGGTFSKKLTNLFDDYVYRLDSKVKETFDRSRAQIEISGTYDYTGDGALMEIHIEGLNITLADVDYRSKVTINIEEAKRGYDHRPSGVFIDPLIVDQVVESGEKFNEIQLARHREGFSGFRGQVIWKVTGSVRLIPNVTSNNLLIVKAPANWVGTESMIITAELPGGVTARDEVSFTVRPKRCIPPEFTDIPSQIKSIGEPFEVIRLLNYVEVGDTKVQNLRWRASPGYILKAVPTGISGSWNAKITPDDLYSVIRDQVDFTIYDPDCNASETQSVTFIRRRVEGPPPPKWVTNLANELGIRGEMVRKVGQIRNASRAEREAFEELRYPHPRNIKLYSSEWKEWRLFGHEYFTHSSAADFTNEVAKWIKKNRR